MDDSLVKKLLIAWVVGFVVAMALAARWRRMGEPAMTPPPAIEEETPADQPALENGETKDASSVARVRQIGTRFGESVVKGMKHDIELIREPFRHAR